MQSKLVDLRDIPTAESLIKKAIGMAENAEPRPTRLLLHARHQLGREFVRQDKASEALPMLLHVAGMFELVLVIHCCWYAFVGTNMVFAILQIRIVVWTGSRFSALFCETVREPQRGLGPLR